MIPAPSGRVRILGSQATLCDACPRGLGALTVRVPIVGSGRPGASRRVTLSGLGCDGCSSCPSSRLGALGLNPLEETVLGKGASLAAGAGATALATGTAVGAVAGPIGIAVGAAVGLIAQMVFGHHANYALIEHNVGARMAMAETYKQIAGKFPGRVYGVKDIHLTWDGLLFEGFFKLNGGGCWGQGKVQSCIANPSEATCPHCNAIEQWVNDLYTGQAADPAERSLTGAARTALNQGLTSIEAADQIFIPHWAPSHGSTGVWVPWAYPDNTQDPQLARQMIIDALDAIMFADNQSLPNWYGTIPTQTSSSAPASSSSSASAIPPVLTPAIQPASTPVASPVAAGLATPPAVGAIVTAIPELGTGAMLTLPAGTSYTYAGTDASGGWAVQDSSGNLWHLSGSSLVPLASAGQAGASSTELQSGGGYVPSSYGLTPAQSGAAAPAGTAAAMTAGPSAATFSTSTLALLAALGVGVVILAKRNRHDRSSSS